MKIIILSVFVTFSVSAGVTIADSNKWGCIDESFVGRGLTDRFEASYSDEISDAVHGYTNHDYVFLNGYLDSGYQGFNPFFVFRGETAQAPVLMKDYIRNISKVRHRDWPEESEILNQMKLINDAFEATPKSPCDFYVYSGQVSPMVFEEGEAFKFESYLSTSLRKKVALVYADNNEVTYPISHMYDVSEISEAELNANSQRISEFNKYLFKITVPKDSQLGIVVGAPNYLAAYLAEDEFLMRPNLCLFVDKKEFDEEKKHYKLDISVVSNDQCQ